MFNVGDRVISEYYGEGTVIKVEYKPLDNYPICVQFDKLDLENGDTDGIQYFREEGYYDCDKKESEMIRLIEIKSTQTNDINEDFKEYIKNPTYTDNINKPNNILSALSDNNRKFKIKYRDIMQYINKDPLSHSKVKTITGTIENFNTNAEVVINGDKEYGFCIIQYRQILQMEEIREVL